MPSQADTQRVHTTAPASVPGGPHKNAVTHGLRSATVLLPGDDAAAFLALRRELFHEYQPCTREEADCVESIAGYKWRIAHGQRIQSAFRVALDGLVLGGPAGHICEPDPHRWQHRAMDCTLDEQRMHKLMTSDRNTLLNLQWMRRNRLIDGALAVPSYLDFLAEGEPSTALEAVEEEPAASWVKASLPGASPTGSADRRIHELGKRTPQAWTSPQDALDWLQRRALRIRPAPKRRPRVEKPGRNALAAGGER